MHGLKVGMEFAKLASLYADEGNMPAAQRNLEAAQKAYEALLRFLPKAKLTPSQRERVERDLSGFKESLDTLASRMKIDPAPDD